MFKLYARVGAGSAAVEALLATANAPHTIIDVPREANGAFPDWYLRLNPRGEVPSLGLPDDSIMTESAAMMIFIADLFPGKELAPPPTSVSRASYLRWMVYLATAPYMSDLRMYYPDRYSTDPAHAESIKARAVTDLARDFALLADQMGKGPFILGDSMTAVDIYAAMLLSWAPDVNALFQKHINLKHLYDGVAANPVIRKVWDRNKMP